MIGVRELRILVEIVHPADVLFFQRPIQTFLTRGDEVAVVSRHKDLACDLLDRFGINHTPMSRASSGIIGLGMELAQRVRRISLFARKFRPEAMLGFGGVAISHVGRLMKIPSVVFYDSENARLQTRLAWPFVSHLTVPEDYQGTVPKGRTERLPGTKDLSFFHPTAFTPDRERALRAGLDPDRKNVVLRFVSWNANHDIGKTGWQSHQISELISALDPDCALHVSAEGDADPLLAPHIWTGDPTDMHHLMAFSDLVAGESATMACEAAALGVPSIYAGVDFPGYVDGLDQRGLVKALRPEQRASLTATALSLINNRESFDASRSEWLANCPDWARAIVDTTDRMARNPW